MSNSKIDYVIFKSDMSADFFFHGGLLFISDNLSAENKMEIIREYMRITSCEAVQ